MLAIGVETDLDMLVALLSYIDTSTFCHVVKRWHGMPPSAYLRESAALRAANPWLVASAAAGTTSAKLT